MPILARFLWRLFRIYYKPVIIFEYPTLDGKGGKGLTVFISIVTSFIVFDSWPEYGSAKLVLVSCKPFDCAKVRRYTEMAFGEVEIEYMDE